MALNKTLDLAEEEKKKALEEELKARQQALHKERMARDASVFQKDFMMNQIDEQNVPQEQAVSNWASINTPAVQGTWDNTPGKLSMPEQWAANALSPEAPRNPEVDAMVLGDGDAPVSPEQAQAQVDSRSKLQQNLDALKINAPAAPAQPVYGNVEAPDFIGQALQAQQQPDPAAYNTQFNQLEAKHGLPLGYLDATAMIESGKNPNAKNKSGASGLFQFMPGTAGDYNLTDPFDPVASTEAMIRFTKDNQAHLQNALGREPTGEELYLAHQQGRSGAVNLIKADPNANAASILGLAKVKQNGGNENTTVGEFKDMWAAKYNKYSGNVQPIKEAAPVQERVFTDDDVEATSDGGVSNATKSGIPQSAAVAASQRQYDENGKFVLKSGEEGLNFRSDFIHRDRSTTDMGALFQGLLAGGIAMLGVRLAGGTADDAGLAFAVGAGGRFINAMNESHRYKNIEALTKMGYTPESIEEYVASGQRDSLKKFEYGKWEEYPDGSGDMYRQLPNGDTEFRKGVPKWETIDTVNEKGETVRSYWNPVHGWRQRPDANGAPQKFEHVVARLKPETASSTPQTYIHTNPTTGQKEEVTVFTTPNGYVKVEDRTSPVTLGSDAQLKDKPTKAGKGTIDPNSVEGKQAMMTQRYESETRRNLIGQLADNPALANVTDLEGILFGGAYEKLDPETKYLLGQFNQLFNKDFLENIQKMKGFGSLSNAEGLKVAGASSALTIADKEGKISYNQGLPTGAVLWELRQMVEGSLGYEFMVDYVQRNGSEPVPGTPEFAQAKAEMQAYVEERMPDKLKGVTRYIPGQKKNKEEDKNPGYSKGTTVAPEKPLFTVVQPQQ